MNLTGIPRFMHEESFHYFIADVQRDELDETRVFIRAPSAKDSFQFMPVSRAVILVPPSLPSVARPMIRPKPAG